MVRKKGWINLLKNLILPAIIFIYFFSMLKAWWPGQMSKDSLDQYLMAIKVSPLTDWHPPAMSLLWRVLNNFLTTPSPAALFVFHLSLYLFGIYLCLIYISKNHLVRVFLFTILSLFVSSQQIVIWKDTGMVGSLLVAIGASLILNTVKKKQVKRFLLALTFVALLYATSIRWNAFPAIIVISFFAIYSYFKKETNIKIISITLISFSLLFFISTFINYSISDVKKTYPIQNVLVYDLVGMLQQVSPEKEEEYLYLVPRYWQANQNDLDWQNIQTSKKLYNPISVGNLIFGGNIPLTEDKQEIAILKASWGKAILLNPSTYLRHRLQIFKKFINLEQVSPYYPYNDWIHGNNLGIHSDTNKLKLIFRSWYKVIPDLFYYPWFWLAINLIEVFVAAYLLFRKKINIKKIASFFMVWLSGISYMALLFFIVPSADFRYAYYLVVSSLLSLFLLLKEIFGSKINKG